jgi:hypothetical protein
MAKSEERRQTRRSRAARETKRTDLRADRIGVSGVVESPGSETVAPGTTGRYVASKYARMR